MCLSCIQAIAFCAILLSVAAQALDWPSYRHDASRSGQTEEEIALPLPDGWVFTPGHPPSPAWPVPDKEVARDRFDEVFHCVSDGARVYFGSSSEDKVVCLDAATGAVIWTAFTEGPVRLAPTLAAGKVYVGSDDGCCYCFAADNGKLVWKTRASHIDERVMGNGRMISLWPIRTGVAVDGGIAYFGAGVFPGEGLFMCAADAETGRVIWRNDNCAQRLPPAENYGGFTPQGYILVSRDTIFVPSGRSMPVAYSRKDGNYLYSCSPGGKRGGTWALLTDNQLVAGVNDKVAYDIATGAPTTDAAFAWFPGTSLVATNDFSFLLNENGVYAVDRARFRELKAKRQAITEDISRVGNQISALEKVKETTPASAKLVESQMADLVKRRDAFRAERNELEQKVIAWKTDLKDCFSMIRAGKTLFIGGQDFVCAVESSSGKLIWKGMVQGKAQGLAVSGGRLFASSDNGRIYCFGAGSAQVKIFEKHEALPPSSRAAEYAKAAGETVRSTGIRKGVCLVLDCVDGGLIEELVSVTELEFVGLAPDSETADRVRKRLDSAGLYGSRAVIHVVPAGGLPYVDYFANLIVSEGLVTGSKFEWSGVEIARVLRPLGGTLMLPAPLASGNKGAEAEAMKTALEQQTGMPVTSCGSYNHWLKMVRGALPGSGEWTHQYADESNTACAEDVLVKPPLGVLWFGKPGPDRMVERHARAAAPVSADGRLFVQGENLIMAYDAYNGVFLWEREIPGAVRVRVDCDAGNLALSDDGLYVAAEGQCHRLEPETGRTLGVFPVPKSASGKERRWGYIACSGKTLIGTAAKPLSEYGELWNSVVDEECQWCEPREKLDQRSRDYLNRLKTENPIPNDRVKGDFNAGGGMWHSMAKYPAWGNLSAIQTSLTEQIMTADAIFALDSESGQTKWVYDNAKMAHPTICIGDGKVFFAESSVTDNEKEEALRAKRASLPGLAQADAERVNIELKNPDVRRVVALDLKTGKRLWERVIDLTSCGGDRMGSACSNGRLFFFGCFSNHDRALFASNQLTWRRITALNASNGTDIWSKPLNYLRRPVIVGDKIIIEPRACWAATGEIVMREHPTTGQKVPWEFIRAGHSCGVTSAATNCIFLRSDNTTYCDMARDTGMLPFGAVRAGCWINMVPANGLLMFPEASSGCTCSYPIRSSVVMRPRREDRTWGIFVAHGDAAPVKRIALNLGAPGDRRDSSGTLWLGWPRPQVTYGMKVNAAVEFMSGMGYFDRAPEAIAGAKTDTPWIFASGCRGITRLTLPLIDTGQTPGFYTVRLLFMEPEGGEAGKRVFDIKLQGKVEYRDLDIVQAAGRANKAILIELAKIPVADVLTVEFVPKAQNPNPASTPILNGIEVIREDVENLSKGSAQDSAERRQLNDLIGSAGDRSTAFVEFLRSTEQALKDGKRDEAIRMLHVLLTVAEDDDFRSKALARLSEVGDLNSTTVISRFWRKADPILSDYRPQAACSEAVRKQSLQTYIAIASRIGAGGDPERQQAVALLREAMAQLPGDLETRAAITAELSRLGYKVGDAARAQGFITQWKLAGPFPFGGADNADKVFVAEPAPDMNATYEVAGRSIRWREYVTEHPTGMVDLERIFAPNINVSAYACGEFEMAEDADILLKIGSDDSFKCWFNGAVAGRSDEMRGYLPDQDVLKVRAKKGLNTVLIKVCQGSGEWAVGARVTDANGRPVPIRK